MQPYKSPSKWSFQVGFMNAGQIQLFKFKLGKANGNQLSASPLVRHLRFPRNNSRNDYDPSTEPAALYATTDGGTAADPAHQELALTYTPGYRYTFDAQQIFKPNNHFTVKDNQGRKVNNLQTCATVPRIWPAFGLSGGRREVIIIPENPTQHNVPLLLNSETPVPNGGCPSLWYMDDTRNVTLLLHLLSGIHSGVSGVAARSEERFAPQGIEGTYPGVMREGGVALNVHIVSGQNANGNITLSAALVRGMNPSYPLLSILKVRFWVALWKDTEYERQVLSPPIEPIDHSISGCYRCRTPPHPKKLKEVARQAAEILMDRAGGVSAAYFDSHSTTISLPG